MAGGANGILSFRKKWEPETTLSIRFRSLKITAVRSLQSYMGAGDGLIFVVQNLTTDCADPGRPGCSEAAKSERSG